MYAEGVQTNGQAGKLTDLHCKSAGLGTLSDGGGLLLQCRQGVDGINKSWAYRYSVGAKQHWVGLGSYPVVTLARAREKAMDMRRLRADGHDPLAAKRDARASLRREQAKQTIPTFDECRDAYVASHRDGWRSVKHSHEWVRSLRAHVTPIFGATPVDMVDTALVCRALEPLWRTATETASRVRGRVEGGVELGPNPWLSHRRKPRTMAWTSFKLVAQTIHGGGRRAFCQHALR